MALRARGEDENRLFHARAVVVGDFRRKLRSKKTEESRSRSIFFFLVFATQPLNFPTTRWHLSLTASTSVGSGGFMLSPLDDFTPSFSGESLW